MVTTELKKFYEDEVNDVIRVLNAGYCWVKPKEVVHNAVNRCLGAAYFVQKNWRRL